MAEQQALDVSINNLSIDPDSVSTSTFKANTIDERISKISPRDRAVDHLGLPEISTFQVSMGNGRLLHRDSLQISLPKINSNQRSEGQSGSFQVAPFQVGIVQESFAQVSSLQNRSSEISTSQLSSAQINSAKISFSSNITLQQFFSSHNFNLQNTSVPTWLEFLQGTSPFNLTIKIQDLPTGQLAEAQITQFSNSGTPTGGTLLLDTDANGLGWFIDPTPWENSEFTQTLTDTAYRATPGSDAYGHYDLLTTLLHETAHLQGFIAGYSNCDRHIQSINGSKTFVGDGFSAIFTPDGSHLSQTFIIPPRAKALPFTLINLSIPDSKDLPTVLTYNPHSPSLNPDLCENRLPLLLPLSDRPQPHL
ncbi:MAG: hypothetical protein MH252_11800 [Thermosynechococcaceae cyanobacterium MS004]|nr:hypothetical protein [Thermosynechococcaceae cyanobacterium MS004]